MSALCEKKHCSSCRGRHDLCLAGSDRFDGNQEYEYICPKTGAAVRFWPGDPSNRVVPTCPRGSVRAMPLTP
jgi:hypothetical protein